MDFLHSRQYLKPGQAVSVDCDTQANIMLTDDVNYQSFKNGRNVASSYGGFYTHFPAVIRPPHGGYWNVTIDLGGGSAHIRYSVSVIN